jgi:adenine-specific DNA-methyltransferase
MENIKEELENLLKQDDRLITDDGTVMKNKVVELAHKVDEELLKLLMSSDRIKQHFFKDISGTLVFDKVKFQDFVNLKEFLADSYTKYKSKIGLQANGDYLSKSKEVELVWPYKDCVLEGGQTKEERENRKEIFWNETLAPDQITRLLSPKALNNFKTIDKKGEHELSGNGNFLQENLILKGNNLMALHSLKERFLGKIKLIYIDPPYNTQGDANTFLYNNSFNHSTWLTFMKSRLEVARELMKNDGVIAIAIDDEEYAYLKVLCDDVFGRDNHIGTLVIQIKPSGRTNDAYFATCHEYVLFYSKIPNKPTMNFFELSEEEKRKYTEGAGEELYKWRDFLRTGGYSTPEERPNSFYAIYYNPKTGDISLKNNGEEYIEILPIDSNGSKRVWRKTPESFYKHLKDGEIKIVSKNDGKFKVQIIDKIKMGTRPKSVWVDSKYDASSHGTKLLKKLFEGNKVFSFPKSIHAVKDVIELFTERGGSDLVLDFFGGSGTTGHAVLDINQKDEGARKFILCEQMDYAETMTTQRIQKVLEEYDSDEHFIVANLAKDNARFIQQIEEADNTQTLKAIWQTMQKEGFLSYRLDETRVFDEADEESLATLSLDEQKQILIRTLDFNHLYINYSEIEDERYNISKEEKALNRQFYSKDQ